MRKLVVALSLLATLALALPGLARAQGSCNPDSETIPTSAFHTDLAYRWAPFVIQDTAGSGNRDMIGKINFDNDWTGRNNWENLPSAGIAPYLYYNVVETSTHYFVFYHTFHPRDWNNLFFGTCGPDPDCHENDSENLLITIRKDASTYGEFRSMVTKAHSDFYQYALSGTGVSNGTDDLDNDPERGFTLFVDSSVGITDPRPATYIESKGHGVCEWWDNNGPTCSHPNDKVGTSSNDGIYYYPDRNATPAVPPNPSGGQWYNHKRPYNLVSLWDDVWVLRSCYGNATGYLFGPTMTYPGVSGNGSSLIGEAMDGDTYGDDAATAYWAQTDTSGQGFTAGEWGFDPSATMHEMLTFTDTWSTTYTYNPYFGIQ